jgi:hypothetical protein
MPHVTSAPVTSSVEAPPELDLKLVHRPLYDTRSGLALRVACLYDEATQTFLVSTVYPWAVRSFAFWRAVARRFGAELARSQLGPCPPEPSPAPWRNRAPECAS